MANFIWRNALTGGGDALDGVASAGLTTGDAAIVVIDGATYTYRYDSTDNSAESLPNIVEPDDGGGAWRLENTVFGVLSSDPASPQTGSIWIRSDTSQLCVKLAAGTLYFEAFQYVAD